MLELAAEARPLPEVLDALAREIERAGGNGMLASILLLDDDGTHLRHGAAPSLPTAYNELIDGIEIGPAVGSCGTAAFRGEPVIVEDVQSDPLWSDFRELAGEHGLAACWSNPIWSSRGELLGTFAMYYREPRAPAPGDLDLVGAVTRTAAIAIERQRAEDDRARLLAAERAARAELEALFTEAPALLAVMRGPEHVFERANPAFLRIAGGDEVLGRPAREVFSEIGEAYHRMLDEVYSSGEPVFVNEARVRLDRRGDGMPEDAWFSFSFQPLRDADGTVSGIYLNSVEVTEQVEARVEAERRAHATVAFTFVRDGVVLVDDAGLVRSWNPAAERITGVAQGDALARPIAQVLPDWAGIAPRIPVSGAAESDPAGATAMPLRFDGRGEVWLALSGTVFEHGTVYTFRDVTDERALDRVRSDVIATVSHELRTPLAAVYGAAMTLQRQDLALDRSGRAPFLAMIESNAQRLAAIVDEILLAGKLEEDAVPVSIEALDAAELVRRVLAELFDDPQEVELVSPPALPLVGADREKLGQVLANLIDNAVKYSNGSPIRVHVEPAERAIRLAVSDSGIGIPRDEIERVFEKFYRVDTNMSSGVGGTGLGLYICRELVRRMGGRIWAESRLGEGSAFYVELPVADS